MWKYIPRPGEKVPKPRGGRGADFMKIGQGDDGVEVVKTMWMTKTKDSAAALLSRSRLSLPPHQGTSSTSGAASKFIQVGTRVDTEQGDRVESQASGNGSEPNSLEQAKREFTGVRNASEIDANGVPQRNKASGIRAKGKRAAQLQNMTPESMHAQMEAARAKVARWSRSFMIFQFYTVPGRSAVAASVEMLLKGKSDVDNGSSMAESGQPPDDRDEETAERNEGLDETSRRMTSADRRILGWGGIENYYKGKGTPHSCEIIYHLPFIG